MRANATVGWQHAFGDIDPTAALAFADGGAGFSVAGAPIAEDAALLGLGLDFTVTGRVSLSIGYNGRIGDQAAEHAAVGKLAVSF